MKIMRILRKDCVGSLKTVLRLFLLLAIFLLLVVALTRGHHDHQDEQEPQNEPSQVAVEGVLYYESLPSGAKCLPHSSHSYLLADGSGQISDYLLAEIEKLEAELGQLPSTSSTGIETSRRINDKYESLEELKRFEQAGIEEGFCLKFTFVNQAGIRECWEFDQNHFKGYLPTKNYLKNCFWLADPPYPVG